MSELIKKTISNIPSTWATVQLETLGANENYPIGDGDHGKIIPEMYVKTGIPYIRVKDMGWGTLSTKNMVFISKNIHEKNPKSHLKPRDIIISKTGTLGKCAIIPDSMKSANTTSSVGKITINQKFTLSEWILYYFLTPDFTKNMLKVSNKSVQQGFNIINLKKFQIPLAPLNEQKRIVAKIEELLSQINRINELMKIIKKQFLDEFESFLIHAFSGKITEKWRNMHEDELKLFFNKFHDRNDVDFETIDSKLKNIVNKQNVVPEWVYLFIKNISSFVSSGSRGWAKYYSEKGAFFVTVSDLNYDKLDIDFSKTKQVKLPEKLEGKRTLLKKDDILIAITGATVGKIGVLKETPLEAYVNQHVALVRSSSDIYSEYLGWYLLSPLGQKQIQKSQKGVTKEGLGLDDVKHIIIPITTLNEQRVIVNEIENQLYHINKNFNMINQLESKISKITFSILKQAFEGKLVPQDPNDEPAEILLQKIKQEKEQLIQKQKPSRSTKNVK